MSLAVVSLLHYNNLLYLGVNVPINIHVLSLSNCCKINYQVSTSEIKYTMYNNQGQPPQGDVIG